MRLQSSPGKINTARSYALAVLMAMAAYGGTAQALTLGHSVLLSAPGAPLLVTVSVKDLTPVQQDSLRVMIPDETAWAQASLTPPVSLASLKAYLEPGYQPGTRLVRITSDQPFTGAVADILLDIQTATGQKRHQVTLLPHADAHIARAAVSSLPGSGATGMNKHSGSVAQPGHTITVRRGDTLFSIARRNAIEGITAFQFLAALYQANPHAFSQLNMNLLRAGTVLTVPDTSALTALTDRQARQFFMQHLSAFNAYRAGKVRSAGVTASLPTDGSAQEAASGTVSMATESASAPALVAPGDRLRLSSVAPAADPASGAQSQAGANSAMGEQTAQGVDQAADQYIARQRAVQEAQGRVSALETNVRDLQQLQQQAQGGIHSSSSAGTSAVQATGSMSPAAQLAGQSPAPVAVNPVSGDPPAGSAMASVPSNALTPVTSTENAPSAASSAVPAEAMAASSERSTSGIRSSISPAVLSSQVDQTTGQASSWLKDRMAWVIGGLVVLIGALVVWFVRQRKSALINGSGDTVITEAMIREKLQHVDLNLDSDVSSKGRL